MAGHLYAVPTEAGAARIRSAFPGALVCTWPQYADATCWRTLLRRLCTVAKLRRCTLVGWCPEGPLSPQPRAAQILLAGAGWMIRPEDAKRVLARAEPLLADAAKGAGLEISTTEPVPDVVVMSRPCGGLGDLVTILGGLQSYKAAHPEQAIHLHTVAPIGDIARGHPDIHAIHTSTETLPRRARIFRLGIPCPARKAELTETHPSVDRITLFARVMGVPPSVPRIYLTQEELAAGQAWVAERTGGAPPVLLVWRTKSAYKDYPHVGALYHRLRLSVRVIIVEHQRDVPGPNTRGLSIRQVAAVVAASRLVVCGDTGWLHVAGALGRPVVGLYGSQNPITRQAPYGVPGGWLTGTCPHGRQPCCERCCGPLDQTTPCMDISPVTAEKTILETLSRL